MNSSKRNLIAAFVLVDLLAIAVIAWYFMAGSGNSVQNEPEASKSVVEERRQPEAPPAGSGRKYLARNIVVLVIDGPRHMETWGDSSASNIPNLAGNLAPLGVLYTNFRNNGSTRTNPGHAALSTGFYEDIDNGGYQLPSRPSFMQYWRRNTGSGETAAWIIASKNKLHVIANTSDVVWKGKFQPSQYCGTDGLGRKGRYAADSETWEVIKERLEEDHPRIVFINLREPDFSGHRGVFEPYVSAMRQSDSYAWALWNVLESDSYYAGRTAFFITNDHGRHLDGVSDGFSSHGDDCEGCRRISLIAIGPDFKKGAVFDTQREQIDLPETIAEILGFRIPGSEGDVMEELFAL